MAREEVEIEQQPLGEGRETALDFLRGIYIILACMQHFAGVGNALDLPASPATCALFWMLTPSGDQIFLALAAFNLARRDHASFKTVYPRKLYTFGVLFLVFVLESFVRAFDLASALSWGPMLTWMVVLAIVATVYRVAGPRGIVGLFLAQMVFWLLPMREFNDQLETQINVVLGLQGVRYESRIDLFLGSGCVGFLLGYLYYHFKAWGTLRLAVPVVVGALMMAVNVAWGPEYLISPFNLFANEYQVAESLPGIVSIWGTIAVFICAALAIDCSFLKLQLPIVNWCGEHSLIVFVFHLVLFMRVILPLRIHFAQLWDAPLHNGLIDQMTYTAIVIAVCWAIRKSRVLTLIER